MPLRENPGNELLRNADELCCRTMPIFKAHSKFACFARQLVMNREGQANPFSMRTLAGIEMNARVKKVALLIESSNGYSRGLIRGAFSFGHQQGNWSVFLPEQERGGTPPQWFSKWKGDGVLARIETPEIARFVDDLNLPVVDLSAARLRTNSPWVETDDRQISQLAAEHLLSRGFRNLGFCGNSDFNWSNWRQHDFQSLFKRQDRLFMFSTRPPNPIRNLTGIMSRERLAAWVSSVPKPIGVMACYDNMARQLLDICHEADLGVPEDVAVIGVDNDPLICELSDPPLTSVETNPVRLVILRLRCLVN